MPFQEVIGLTINVRQYIGVLLAMRYIFAQMGGQYGEALHECVGISLSQLGCIKPRPDHFAIALRETERLRKCIISTRKLPL